jgi:hypothetical protein
MAVQVDSIKTRLKSAYGLSALCYNMMNRFLGAVQVDNIKARVEARI